MPPEASISSLDDGLIVRIFSQLSLEQRCKIAAVCRRWRQCASSPELVRTVDATLAVGCGLPAVESWAEWMLRHVQHVEDLAVDLQSGEVAKNQLLAGTLFQCGMAGRLRSLSVDTEGELSVPPWLPRLTLLTALELRSGERLHLPASLAALAQLRMVDFRARTAGVAGAVDPGSLSALRLPRQLSSLYLCISECSALPQQLTELSGLSRLALDGFDQVPGDGFAGLTALASLRTLCLSCGELPACLSRLTALEALQLFQSGINGGSGLPAALGRLTNLRSLELTGVFDREVDAAVATLHLHHLSLVLWGGEAAALPAGAMAGSLRRLCTSFGTLARSLPLLQAAARLGHVCVLEGPPKEGLDCGPFFDWALRHPSLSRLTFDMPLGEPVPAHFFFAALALQRSRPLLSLKCEPGFAGAFPAPPPGGEADGGA